MPRPRHCNAATFAAPLGMVEVVDLRASGAPVVALPSPDRMRARTRVSAGRRRSCWRALGVDLALVDRQASQQPSGSPADRSCDRRGRKRSAQEPPAVRCSLGGARRPPPFPGGKAAGRCPPAT
jgi:hypothetical protein